MNKICTSIKQSKKLIELGIDVNTADMGWNVFVDETTRILPIDDWDLVKNGSSNVKFYPAWSLTALLDILAKETHNIDEDGYIILSSYKGNWWDISPINCCSEGINESNNPLDAAFEMVVWLLENKKI